MDLLASSLITAYVNSQETECSASFPIAHVFFFFFFNLNYDTPLSVAYMHKYIYCTYIHTAHQYPQLIIQVLRLPNLTRDFIYLTADLYAAVLNEHMGGDFYVKSWGRLQKPLPSNCSVPNSVFNVRTVKLQPYSGLKPYFSITYDHSKWCVTKENTSTPWTCIADMNRAVSQKSRGGGAVCTDNPVVWKAFVKLVNSHQPCRPAMHLRSEL